MAAYPTPPCPMCGVWECLDCGTRTSGRSRYFPGRHHCRTCKSTNGRMLATHHRSDIYDNHTSDVDPQSVCHYPLDDQRAVHPTNPGQVRPSERNAMSTETAAPAPATHQRITAPIHTTLELDPSFWNGAKQVSLPSSLGTPKVSWGFDGGKIETRVGLTIDGTSQEVAFWDTDQDGTLNTAADSFGDDGGDPWEDLEPDDYQAALKWGAGVHARIVHGAEQVTVTAAGHGSEAYNAVIQFATGLPVEAPVLVVHELGEDSDRWLVTGTTEDTHPSLIKNEVGMHLVDSLGVEYDSLPDLIGDLKDAKLTFRDNWVLEPVDPAHPDEESLLKRDEEADHTLPRFAATLVTI